MSRLRLDEWLPVYRRICADLGYDEGEDLRSARELSRLLGARSSKSLAAVRRGFPDSVVICGASASLAQELSGGALTKSDFVVASDTATATIRRMGVTPRMVVTDLDGSVEDQISANAEGAVVFVHAHGDNLSAVERCVPLFPGAVVGTCQCAPPPNVFNFGGFTDGDRAACICAELGARSIALVGFDFEHPAPKPGRSVEVKRKKLAWAKEILEMLSRQGVSVTRRS